MRLLRRDHVNFSLKFFPMQVLEIIDDKVRILSVAEEFLQEDEESPQELRWKDKMEVQNYRM